MDFNAEHQLGGRAWDSMIRRAEVMASQMHLRRLQAGRLGQQTVGYANLLMFKTDATCSSGQPDQSYVMAYGSCDSIPGKPTGSKATLYTIPNDGSSQVITNTTQLFSDSSCTTPQGNPIVAPASFDSAGTPLVLGRCVQGLSPYAGVKVDSLSSYIPGLVELGDPNDEDAGIVSVVYYRTLGDCQGRGSPTRIISYPTRTFIPNFGSCVAWPVTDPLYKAYAYTFQGNAISGIMCFSDPGCTTEPTQGCLSPLPQGVDDTTTINAAIQVSCKPQTDPSDPNLPTTFASACLSYAGSGSPGSCIPPLGVAPVPTSPSPVITGFLKARVYSNANDCSGQYQEGIYPFGECVKDFSGMFNVNSRTVSYSTDSSGAVVGVIQYYSDSACKVANGAPVTVKMTTPSGAGATIKIGSCFNPVDASVSGAQTMILLESIGPSMPAFANSGVMYSGFQSQAGCTSNFGATYISVLNSALCFKSGSGSYYLACNSTSVTYTAFSDAKCQQKPVTSVVPLQSTCIFQGDGMYFHGSSDTSLYQRITCNVAPAPSSSGAADPNNITMIVGVVSGVVGFILLGLLGLYCWSQASKRDEENVSSGLARQDANAIDYYAQQYPPEAHQEMVNRHSASLRSSRGSLGGELPHGGNNRVSFGNRGSLGGGGGRLSFGGDGSGLPQPRPVSYLQPQVTFEEPGEQPYYGEQHLPPAYPQYR